MLLGISTAAAFKEGVGEDVMLKVLVAPPHPGRPQAYISPEPPMGLVSLPLFKDLVVHQVVSQEARLHEEQPEHRTRQHDPPCPDPQEHQP